MLYNLISYIIYIINLNIPTLLSYISFTYTTNYRYIIYCLLIFNKCIHLLLNFFIYNL